MFLNTEDHGPKRQTLHKQATALVVKDFNFFRAIGR